MGFYQIDYVILPRDQIEVEGYVYSRTTSKDKVGLSDLLE